MMEQETQNFNIFKEYCSPWSLIKTDTTGTEQGGLSRGKSKNPTANGSVACVSGSDTLGSCLEHLLKIFYFCSLENMAH